MKIPAMFLGLLFATAASAQELPKMSVKEYAARTSVPKKYLPPPEYDKKFDDDYLTVSVFDNPYEVRERCPKTQNMVACSFVGIPGRCIIVRVSDEYIRAIGLTPELVLRHEMAHCLGWPADHPKARAPTSADLARK
jgi:hypothetical protein